MDKGKRVLPALTGMRFLLGFWVVAYHQAHTIDGVFSFVAVRSLLHTGYTAVSVFFILSGFVLTYNYDLEKLNTKATIRKFAVARFSRIYPAYFAGIALLIPLAIYRLIVGMPIDSTGGLESLLLNLTLLQAWIPEAALTWNYPGWSLSNEAFFYALLPFIGAFFYRLGAKDRRVIAGSSIPVARFTVFAATLWLLAMALPLVTVLLPVYGFGDAPATVSDFGASGVWPQVVRYDPLLRLPEFCMGILLARLYRAIPEKHWLWNRGAWLYLPGIGIALAVLMNGERIPYPLIHNGLLAPVYAMAILGLALGGGPLARWLSMPAMIFLGNASYSMYILHAPLYTWLKLLFTRLFELPAEGVVWFVCYLIVVTTVASVFYWGVEEPLHKWVRRRLSASMPMLDKS